MSDPKYFDAEAVWNGISPQHQALIGQHALVLILCLKGQDVFGPEIIAPYEDAEPVAMDGLIDAVDAATGNILNSDVLPLPPLDFMATSCRVCGCTDALACEGGCSWVQPDLCSACANQFSEPLAIGSTILSIDGECDGAESGDGMDYTGPNATGVIGGFEGPQAPDGYTYDVCFARPDHPDAPVCVRIYSSELRDPQKYKVSAPAVAS